MKNFLSASTAIQLIAKMMDFTKNVHAEMVIKEFSRANPHFLARFGVEELLDYDSTKQHMLSVLKVYIERRKLNQKFETIIEDLIQGPQQRLALQYYLESNMQKSLKYQENQSFYEILPDLSIPRKSFS